MSVKSVLLQPLELDHWSPSQLNELLTCQVKWKLGRLKVLPERAPTPAMALGTMVDGELQLAFEAILEGKPGNIYLLPHPEISNEVLERAQELTDRYLGAIQQELKVQTVQLDLTATINGTTGKMYPDVVFRDPFTDLIVIADIKVRTKMPSQVGLGTNIQLELARRALGYKPDEAQLEEHTLVPWTKEARWKRTACSTLTDSFIHDLIDMWMYLSQTIPVPPPEPNVYTPLCSSQYCQYWEYCDWGAGRHYTPLDLPDVATGSETEGLRKQGGS